METGQQANRAPRNRKNFRRAINRAGTGVAPSAKWLLFAFNLVFWAAGGLLLGIGIFSAVQSGTWNNVGGYALNPAFILAAVGAVTFFLGFCGAVGALRENKCLLKTFMYTTILLVVLEIAAGVLAFVFRGEVEGKIADKMLEAIDKYHTTNEQTDLDDLAQTMQKRFECCGSRNPRDWQRNIYYNCSMETFQKLLSGCGVPHTCCINASSSDVNVQCGFKVFAYPQMTAAERLKWPRTVSRDKYIYTRGCTDALLIWVKSNLIIIGIVAVCVVTIQGINILIAANIINSIDYLIKLLERQ